MMSGQRALLLVVLLSVCCVAALPNADAEEFLQQGDPLGVFHVTKIAGAVGDGVEPGEELCYRCRFGSRPIVMVFARRSGQRVPELVKAIDAAIVANKDSKLRGLVTLLGPDRSVLRNEAGLIAEQSGATQLPIAVAKDFDTGPIDYRLPSDADVAIVLAKDSQVVGTRQFRASQIDVPEVIDAVEALLGEG